MIYVQRGADSVKKVLQWVLQWRLQLLMSFLMMFTTRDD